MTRPKIAVVLASANGKVHPVHGAWWEDLGAEVRFLKYDAKAGKALAFVQASIEASRLPKGLADVVILEGGLATISTIAGNPGIFEECKVFPFVVDPLLWNISKGHEQWSLEAVVKKALVKRAFEKSAGIIAISPMIAREAVELGGKRVITVEPFIHQKEFDELLKNKFNPSTGTVLQVGDDTFYKNFPTTVKAVEKTGLNAILVGKGTEKYDRGRVKGLGWQKSIIPFFGKASLFVHPAIYEAGARNVLEAMAAGVPAAVTKRYGKFDVVEKLDKRLVAENPEGLAKVLEYYFGLSEREKASLSRKARKIATAYSEKRMRKNFKARLLRELRVQRSPE